jgi:hypothetical protein
MKRPACVLVLVLLGAFLGLPLAAALAADGHADCGCPVGACTCGHGVRPRAAAPPCHVETAIEGRSCSRRPVHEVVPLPRLPDGETAVAARALFRLAPAGSPAATADPPPTEVWPAVELPPPRR